MALPAITIIRDTREQLGWVFDPEEKQPSKVQVLGTVTKTLDAGDYSIEGYEHLVRIERKAGFCELFGNMTPVAHKERFIREMEKLKDIPYKYLVIESVLSNDIFGLTIPQFYKSPPVSAVVRWVYELQMDYGIVPIFAGEAGKKTVRYLFETIMRRIKNG
jgi:hypothetical protein